MHQENILFFDFKSSGGTKSKCLHCVPAENEQMALFSCAANIFSAHTFQQQTSIPLTPWKKIGGGGGRAEKEKTVKHEWQWKSMKS